MIRWLAVAGAVGVAVLVCGQCPAWAITPPVVDDNRLPSARPAAPPWPTMARQTCVTPMDVPGDRAGPLTTLGLDAVWPLTRGQGQRVAVIDTGVAPHPRLTRVEAGGDYVSSGDGTQDCDGHGTLVAGIIAAAPDPDGGEFAGVAPDAAIISIRQSSTRFGPADDPSVAGVGDVDTMAMAVRTAADLGATVINISSVACAAGGFDDGALGAALAYAVDTKDVVVVVAAGNVGGANHCPQQPDGTASTWADATVAVSPAWYDDYVLTVGSTGADGAPSAFTLAGPWVDVAAPGEHMVSLNPAGGGLIDSVPSIGGATPISGTSYAAPVVSGLAALIRARFPELTARQVMQRIEATAHRPPQGWDPSRGNGVIDVVAAVSIDGPVPTAAPGRTPVGRITPGPAAPVVGDGRTVVWAGPVCASQRCWPPQRSPDCDGPVVMTSRPSNASCLSSTGPAGSAASTAAGAGAGISGRPSTRAVPASGIAKRTPVPATSDPVVEPLPSGRTYTLRPGATYTSSRAGPAPSAEASRTVA